ncbi:MAG TPA: electron transfer flavoprotein subunit beta/FixA family protein [Dehalococcoidia bacterium]|nr:electron transfer flavoprotein subunit beta/FixA family protein [Dehalococcoidia bacterium]
MLIVVCIKEVPDAAYINIDPATGTLIREGVPSIVNPFDMHALEESLRLKDKYGFQVAAISMGPPSAEETLKNAVAMGVDEVVLLSDPVFSGSDTQATTRVLAEAIKKLAEKEEVAMVICGKQTIDGGTAQVGPGVATRLKYSQLTLVDQIENVDEQAGKVKVRRMLEGRHEMVEATMPALITVVPQINTPREPTVRMQMMAEDAEVELWDNEAMQLPEENVGAKGALTQVRKIFSQIMPESEILGDGIYDPDGAARLLVDALIEEDILSP